MHLGTTTITALTVVAMTTAGTAASCAPATYPTTTHTTTAPTTTAPTMHVSSSDTWVVTDSYYDPEFARRTVICVNSGGDFRTATGWEEIDTPASPLGRPCPAGRILDQGPIK